MKHPEIVHDQYSEFWDNHNQSDNCPGNTSIKRAVSKMPLLGYMAAHSGLYEDPPPRQIPYTLIGNNLAHEILTAGNRKPLKVLSPGEEFILSENPTETLVEMTERISYDFSKPYYDFLYGVLTQFGKGDASRDVLITFNSAAVLVRAARQQTQYPYRVYQGDIKVGEVEHRKFGERQIRRKVEDFKILKYGQTVRESTLQPTQTFQLTPHLA